ncbi:hypothetical protein VUR80DRAFT_868 [Thermomyces stellatus]
MASSSFSWTYQVLNLLKLRKRSERVSGRDFSGQGLGQLPFYLRVADNLNDGGSSSRHGSRIGVGNQKVHGFGGHEGPAR